MIVRMKNCSNPDCIKKHAQQNRDNANYCKTCRWKFPTEKDRRNNNLICSILVLGTLMTLVSLFLPVVKITALNCFIGCSAGASVEVSEAQLAIGYVTSWSNLQGTQVENVPSYQQEIYKEIEEIASVVMPDAWSALTLAFFAVLCAGFRRRLPLPMTPTPNTSKPPKPKKTIMAYFSAIGGTFLKILTLFVSVMSALKPPSFSDVVWEPGYIGSGVVLGIISTSILAIALIMIKVEDYQRNKV